MSPSLLQPSPYTSLPLLAPVDAIAGLNNTIFTVTTLIRSKFSILTISPTSSKFAALDWANGKSNHGRTGW